MDDFTDVQREAIRRRATYDACLAEENGLHYVVLGTTYPSLGRSQDKLGPFYDALLADKMMQDILDAMNSESELEARVHAAAEQIREAERAVERKRIAMQQEGEGTITKVLTREDIEPEYGWTFLVPLTTDMIGFRGYSKKPGYHAYTFCEDGWVDLDFPAHDSMKAAREYASENVDGPLYMLKPKSHELVCVRKGDKPSDSAYRVAWRITKHGMEGPKTYYVGDDGREWHYQHAAGMHNPKHPLDFETEEAAKAWIVAEKQRILDEYMASDDWKKRQASDRGWGATPSVPHHYKPHFDVKQVKVPAKKQLLLGPGAVLALEAGSGD